jgi:hypothetical protein
MTITSPAVGDKATASWADAVAAALNTPLQGETTTGAAVPLSTNAGFASTATVTFTLAVQTRVRIEGDVDYNNSAGVAARYATQAGYNSGASAVIGSFIGVGRARYVIGSIAGALSGWAFGSVLLSPGTYTAYLSVARFSGGNAADTASLFHLSALAIGFS